MNCVWPLNVHAPLPVRFAHCRYGFHHKIRIPKLGRDMVYHYPSCDMYMCGSTPEIYRFNLDQGQFKSPFVATTASAINVVRLNPLHGILDLGLILASLSILFYD